MHTSGHLSVFFTHRQSLHQPVHSKVTGATVGTSFRTLGTRIEAPHIYVLPLHSSTARNLGKKPPSSKLVNLSTPGPSLGYTGLEDSHEKTQS